MSAAIAWSPSSLQAAFPSSMAGRGVAVDQLRRAAGDGAHLLAPLSPLLAGLLDVPAPEAENPPDRFEGAVSVFLAALAREAAGLLVQLDDVQWLDPAGAHLLRGLAAELAGTPLLLVATARPGGPDGSAPRSLEAAGDRLDLVQHLDPSPMSRDPPNT